MAVRGRRGQLCLQFRTRGGARRGAGRPPNGERAGVTHARRPHLARHHAAIVTMKVLTGLPSLRRTPLFLEIRKALAAGKDRFGFRLVHFSIQGDHVHLIAEAEDRHSLSRGMQGLSVRFARAVNRHLDRKGRVLRDRFHERVLKTPRAAQFALRYVLLNARKHNPAAIPCGFVDERSSAPWFAGFARPGSLAFGASAARQQWARTGVSPSPVVTARTWLLRVGYRRAGPFDIDESPSGRVTASLPL